MRLRLLQVTFVILVMAGLAMRVAAVQWNVIPHGDVTSDAASAAAFLRTGTFIGEPYTPDMQGPFYYPVWDIGGKLLDQHPPLWPMLGAGITWLRGVEASTAEAFASFKVAAFLSGVLVLILAFLVGRRLVGVWAGIAIVLWLSASYIMIDYAGNGAFLSLHAALFLLWILAASSKQSNPWLLGAIAGVAYLVNFQTVVLVPATVIVLLAQRRPFIRAGKDIVIVCGVFFLLITPWLIRNALVFGDPFFHNVLNTSYAYGKAGILPDFVDNLYVLDYDLADKWRLLMTSLTTWLPNNTYYIARKLFILAPIAFFFFCFAWIDYCFDRRRVRAMLPLLVLFVLHALLSAGWPVTKFRYFVPMLPLVFLISLEHLQTMQWSSRMRNATVGVIFVAIAAVSAVAYRQHPTRMHYYDGAVTTDPFGGSEELRFAEENGLLPPAP